MAKIGMKALFWNSVVTPGTEADLRLSALCRLCLL